MQFGSEMAAPVEIEDPNWHRSKPLHKECGWKRDDSTVVKLRKQRRSLCASRWSAISTFCWSQQKPALTSAAFSWKCAVTLARNRREARLELSNFQQQDFGGLGVPLPVWLQLHPLQVVSGDGVPSQSAERLNEPCLPPNGGHGVLNLTREGSRHMVCTKIKLKFGDEGRVKEVTDSIHYR